MNAKSMEILLKYLLQLIVLVDQSSFFSMTQWVPLPVLKAWMEECSMEDLSPVTASQKKLFKMNYKLIFEKYDGIQK